MRVIEDVVLGHDAYTSAARADSSEIEKFELTILFKIGLSAREPMCRR